MEELDFNFSKFWVQIHYLPFRLLTPEVALVIGETLGIFISFEDTSEMISGNFMHVRVAIDITLLLCKGRKVAFDDGSAGWIAFKYERFPNICYWRGQVSHNDKCKHSILHP